jgi:hypothetical protein
MVVFPGFSCELTFILNKIVHFYQSMLDFNSPSSFPSSDNHRQFLGLVFLVLMYHLNTSILRLNETR